MYIYMRVLFTDYIDYLGYFRHRYIAIGGVIGGFELGTILAKETHQPLDAVFVYL